MHLRRRGFRRIHRTTGGYILEQLLITLGICAFLIPVTVVLLGTLSRLLACPIDLQDEVSISQLRHVINTGYDFECSGNELSFMHHEKRQRLVLRNGNLCLIDPGTQIFLSDLANVDFSLEGDVIYIRYAHFEKDPEIRCLGHV